MTRVKWVFGSTQPQNTDVERVRPQRTTTGMLRHQRVRRSESTEMIYNGIVPKRHLRKRDDVQRRTLGHTGIRKGSELDRKRNDP